MNLVYISDLDIKGSGYMNIAIPICMGLAERGHGVKIIGLGYKGEEHRFPFAMLPARNFNEATATLHNVSSYSTVDAVIVSFDIPVHTRQFLANVQDRSYKYIGIMPIESDPLSMSWAMDIQLMDARLIISEFGTDEAEKAGVDATHIPIGIDSESWKIPSSEGRATLRDSYGRDADEFIVFTNADNQERKLLSRSMEIFSDFVKNNPDVKAHYNILTRANLSVGWNLYDLATELDIVNKFTVFERGLDFKTLWSLYAIADVHLLTSQSEGLGLPVLEAMSTGVINLGTDCGGIREQIGDGERGFLIPYDYTYRNPFGNNTRYMASRKQGTERLQYIYDNLGDLQPIRDKAKEYALSRSWDNAVDVLENTLLDVMNE